MEVDTFFEFDSINDENIKPCPFCGWKELTFCRVVDNNIPQVAVSCTMCGAIGPHLFKKEKAIKIWNLRMVDLE